MLPRANRPFLYVRKLKVHQNRNFAKFLLSWSDKIFDSLDMNTLGNIIWLILGGFLSAILYFTAGLLMCITIIGIPFGVQLFKFGVFVLMPFGHEVTDSKDSSGCLSLVFNVLWILCGWWEIALIHAVSGLIFCITIIGIPFGVQHFKIALYSLLPFGRTIN